MPMLKFFVCFLMQRKKTPAVIPLTRQISTKSKIKMLNWNFITTPNFILICWKVCGSEKMKSTGLLSAEPLKAAHRCSRISTETKLTDAYNFKALYRSVRYKHRFKLKQAHTCTCTHTHIQTIYSVNSDTNIQCQIHRYYK